MRQVIGALTAVLLAGCALGYVPKPNAEAVVDSALKPGQPVAIVNKTAPRDAPLPVPPYELRVDYRQYADAAITLLRGELEKRGTVVQASASREIRLNFTDIRIAPGPGRMRAVINCTVTTGDGYVRGFEASGVSWNFQAAIDAAIVDVVDTLLTNARVRQYLSE
jgi:hypothetical protein